MPEDEPAETPKFEFDDEMSHLMRRKLSDAEIMRIWNSLDEPKPPLSHLMSRRYTEEEIRRVWDSLDEPKPDIDRLKQLLTRREGLPDDAIKRIWTSLPEPKPDIDDVGRHLAWLPIFMRSSQKYGNGPSFQDSLDTIEGLLLSLRKIDRALAYAPAVTRQILNSLICDDGLTEGEFRTFIRKATTSLKTYFDTKAPKRNPPPTGRPLKYPFRDLFLIDYLAVKYLTLTGRQPATTNKGPFERFCRAVCKELKVSTSGLHNSIRNIL